MTRLVQLITLFICLLSGSVPSAHAGTPMSDRIAVEAGVKAELSKDLALPYAPDAALSGRTCLDGRPTKEFQGDIMEYWVNLECPYCGIEEPLRAQRENPGMCIVVRHSPSDNYGESLKKALSFEALLRFSPNAAHSFWNAVVPRHLSAFRNPMRLRCKRRFRMRPLCRKTLPTLCNRSLLS